MVFITGDTHGDFSRFKSKAAKAIKKDDTLIILGDFGFFWNGNKAEQRNLKKMAKLPYNIMFLDGVHENYDMLNKFPEEQAFGGKVRRIDKRIYYLQRGEIYNIENNTYFTFGGGQPPDFLMDSPQYSYALASKQDILNAKAQLTLHNNEVDFVLTHEPSGRIGGIVEEVSYSNAFLTSIEEAIQYKKWFFGALHKDKIISRRHHAVFQDIIPVATPLTRKQRRQLRKKKKRQQKIKVKQAKKEKKSKSQSNSSGK